jgi:hypothetical protein
MSKDFLKSLSQRAFQINAERDRSSSPLQAVRAPMRDTELPEHT